MIKAVFFDLFFTLVYPMYLAVNEYDIIGISSIEWERYAEDNTLYCERALGKIRTEKEIIDKIVDIMPYDLSGHQKQEILKRRQERMKRALLNIDDEILNTLKILHDKGIKVGLISNSDIIDSKHWEDSPLAEFFDVSVFSCNVGIMKPDIGIYEIAMSMMGTRPEESMFIGDGGSDELYGAKRAGMRTVFTEYLEHKPLDKIEKIKLYADFHIDRFDELLRCLE